MRQLLSLQKQKNPAEPSKNKMTQLLYNTQTRWLFHAHIKIKFSVFYDKALFDDFYGVLEEVDRLYNSYSSDSFISSINRNAGDFVEVDSKTIDILRNVCSFSDIFKGEYDITIMPLIRLWGFYKEQEAKIPSLPEIEKEKRKVDYQKIEIEDNRIRIGKDQEIITGSFIKAYAVDKMIEQMQKAGISDAIVNAGGSTIKALSNESHPYWNVLIKHPETEKELCTVKLANKCLSTSSQSKTFVEIDDVRYGHIISSKTGYPSANKQVGVISDSCFQGDVFSTGLFNLNGDEFMDKMKFLSAKYNIEGYMIDKNNTVYFSEKFKQYIHN